MNRMEAINKEVEALKIASASPRSEPPRPEPRSETPRSRTEAPPPPFSWTGGPPNPSAGGPPPSHGAPQSRTDAPRSQYPQQEPTRNVPHFGGPAHPYPGHHGSNVQGSGFSAPVHPGQPSHPSDPTSSKIPHYNMSSPGSPLNGSVPQWAPGAGTEHRPFDPRDWSVEGKKPSKELRTFDGDMAHYDNWRRRVRDHFVGTNINYSKVFEVVEKEKVTIRWSNLSTTFIEELPRVNWEWIATHLWTFTGGFLEDGIVSRRIMMCSGEEFNGLELWRYLYQQNSGGSAQLENLEREYFVAFPKCDKVADLQPHLAQWVQLKNKYGVGLPVDHLIAMFWKILPDEVRDDVKKQKDLRGNLDYQISYLYGEIGDSMDDKLSRWNLAKLQQQLKFKSKNSTGLNAVGASPIAEPTACPDIPAPPMPDMAAFTANMERMINAAVTRGRTSQRTPVVAQMGHNVVDPSALVEASLIQSLKDAGAAGAKITGERTALNSSRSRKPMGARYQRGTRELMRSH